MTTKDLDKMLSNIADDFANEARTLFPEGSTEPVTSGDLSELAKQTFYALIEYKKAIIQYLDRN